MYTIRNVEEIDFNLKKIWDEFIYDVFNNDKRTVKSGMILKSLISMRLHVYPYNEKNIGGYIKLPFILKCINNI